MDAQGQYSSRVFSTRSLLVTVSSCDCWMCHEPRFRSEDTDGSARRFVARLKPDEPPQRS